MKREKCSFFKKHIQYLGHLVSEQGFEPFSEKLKYMKHASTTDSQGDEAIFGSYWLLSEIHTMVRRHFKTFNQTRHHISLDGAVSESIQSFA